VLWRQIAMMQSQGFHVPSRRFADIQRRICVPLGEDTHLASRSYMFNGMTSSSSPDDGMKIGIRSP